MKKLTINEIAVLDAFTKDCYVRDHGWEDPLAGAWVDGFHEECNMSGKTFSGVMSSLIKKDILWTLGPGESFGLTDKGRKIVATYIIRSDCVVNKNKRISK